MSSKPLSVYFVGESIPVHLYPTLFYMHQMRTASRSTRRTSQPLADKENQTSHAPSQHKSVTTMPSRKARHRLSTKELVRLEGVFRQETHPSRQKKRDLAAELGMDYKTVTIWFQNKRQTSKRGQPPVDDSDRNLGRTRADSCLRNVSSPSQNATLDASGVDLTADYSGNKHSGDGLNTIASKAIVIIKPLLDSLGGLMSRPRERSKSMEVKDEAPNVEDTGPHQPRTLSQRSVVSVDLDIHAQTAEDEQIKGKAARWKRIRTLEWACEHQTKRRKLSRETYVRLGSEDVEDGGPSNTRMDSAFSLLSLASSTPVGPPKDVMRGASLLLSLKHSWRRK